MKFLTVAIIEGPDQRIGVRLLDDGGEFEPTAREQETQDALARAITTLLAASGAERIHDPKQGRETIQ